MAIAKEVQDEVEAIFKTSWKTRAGLLVPEAQDVGLGNDAVTLDGAVLYADLAQSTDLVDSYKSWFAAEVYKAYLLTACRLIRANGGEITAFDGDRVMAVYLGDTKESDAARTALNIAWAVKTVINPSISRRYPNTAFELQQTVGIDSSALFVARTGVRRWNDLVWVGRAANYAAKLCGLRDGAYNTFITEAVYSRLSDAGRYGGSPRQLMWEKVVWPERGIPVYRSNWRWAVA